MNSWVEQEFRDIDLGDKRRNERFVTTLNLFISQPESTVPEASSNWYETKATYNFWKSDEIEENELIKPHYASTLERAKSYTEVLALHDTTNVAFASSATGLGYLDHGKGNGVLLHNSLLISDSGLPLGIIHQDIWVRDRSQIGKRANRQNKDIEDKESYKWLKGIIKASEHLEGINSRVIHIADRESDIYELLVMERKPNHELLIRATHDRKTKEGERLWAALRNQTPCTQIELEITKPEKGEIRTACLDVCYAEVEILPPKTKAGKDKPTLILYAILVEEKNPPEKAEKISWMLLTTLNIETTEDALKCVERYRKRWMIERYHYVLKSGCKVEELKLRDVKQLRTALITFSIVAFRLMQLTYLARIEPAKPCEGELSKNELQALYCITKKTNKFPDAPPTIKEVVLWISKLGGFLGRKGDGEPGLKVLWKGMKRLNDITEAWVLFNEVSFG